ncbi:MAG: hypothetical protein E7162_05945 [Firmicutes bacterium]|nr:hypothetical protein [Bacillota bacterium]
MKHFINKIKIIIFIITILSTYIYTLSLLDKINLNINEKFYNKIINNSSSLTSNNIMSYKNFKEIINFKPNQLLNNNLVYIEKENKNEIVIEHVNNEIQNKDPIIYIYNTHQTENYSTDYLADYTITPNIMIASYMLKENLEEYGIYSYVEENSVKEVLNKNKWKYAKSYKVTREFMEKRNKEITTFKYYIDLHRDSVKKKYTTTTINGINYAKIMLLVGLDHKNYKENLEEATKINNLLNKMYPGISRGIYKKSGPGVNGIYNQDYSKYVFLFEIGGVENNISEVNNTITALSEVLVKYIKNEGDVTY